MKTQQLCNFPKGASVDIQQDVLAGVEVNKRMKLSPLYVGLFSVSGLLVVGCGGNPTQPISPAPATCTASTKPEFAYALTGYAVSMFTVDSCTGKFTASTPASISTGYAFPQPPAEQMVADPKGRFAYVANPVSNASDLATISMYTIDPATGVLSPTTPATVATGFYPQGIAIDPSGRFVYTANSDDSSVSMFTIDQTTGVLTPTTPASVSTLLPGESISDPGFLTVDPAGKYLYVSASDSNGATVSMYSIDQTTGVLTPTTPATVIAGGIPFQVVVTPSDKFAYVVNNLSGGTYTDAVSQYTVDPSTGVLTESQAFGLAAGNAPTAIAVDPTSSFAYVVNRLDDTLSMYKIDQATGNLTLNSTTQNPSGTIATGTEPFRIDFDTSGKFAYVTNEGSAASVYTVNSDGTLTNVGSTGVPTGALSTVFTTVSH